MLSLLLQNAYGNIISPTPSGFPWANNSAPMPTAAAAGMLGLLWVAEDAAAAAAMSASGRRSVQRLTEPARQRLQCWGLQLVSKTACTAAVDAAGA